jgi:hypothetical protein
VAATIGRRPKDDQYLSDATNTPAWLCDRLPIVDFDPASNSRSHVKTRWSWSLEKGYDGIKMPWRGSGFINWPFSSPRDWAGKANYELSLGRCTNLIILCKLDTSTSWWPIITAPIMLTQHLGDRTTLKTWHHPDLWLFHDRIEFDEHPELIERRVREHHEAKARGEKPKTRKSGKSSANFVSCIIHHRFNDESLALEDVADRWSRRPT